MCEPLSIASGVMSAGSAIAGGISARKKARADAAHARRLAIHNNEKYRRNVEYQYDLARWRQDNYYRNAAASAENARDQYSTILDQVDQVQDRAIHEMEMAGRQADKATAFIRAAASETGTQGNSVRLAKQEIRKAEAEFSAIGFKNLKGQLRQSERSLNNIHARAQTAVNQAMPNPMGPIDPAAPIQAVHQPSMAPYLMQAGGAALGAAANYQSRRTAMMGLDMKAVELGHMSIGSFNSEYGTSYDE